MSAMLNKLKRSLMGSNPTGPAASTGLAASTVERDDEGTKSSEPKFAGSTDESLPDGVYEVERIISHQGNLKQKSQMRFLVRWKGYSETDDTWESYWNVNRLEAFKNYLPTMSDLKVTKKKKIITTKKDEIGTESEKIDKKHNILEKEAYSSEADVSSIQNRKRGRKPIEKGLSSVGDNSQLKSKKMKNAPLMGEYQLTTAESLSNIASAVVVDNNTTSIKVIKPRKNAKIMNQSEKKVESDSESEMESEPNLFLLPEGVHIPECIVAHTGDAKNFKYRMLFKVHWKGYNEEEDTWESYSRVRRLDVFKSYLDLEKNDELKSLLAPKIKYDGSKVKLKGSAPLYVLPSINSNERRAILSQFLQISHDAKANGVDFVNGLISEYLRFMSIKIARPAGAFAPSILIEKLWQAHILCTQEYWKFCDRNNHGLYIHHECSVENPDPNAFRNTIIAYQDEYGEPNRTYWYDEENSDDDNDSS